MSELKPRVEVLGTDVTYACVKSVVLITIDPIGGLVWMAADVKWV